MLPKYFLTISLSLIATCVPVFGQDANQGSQNQDNNAALIVGVKEGRLEPVARLLSAGASPDATDDTGSTALCWAIRVNNIDILKLLIAQGATVDQEESDGASALDIAAMAGRSEMVRLLLSYGARADHKDEGGHTPLISASFGAMFRDAPSLAQTLMPEAGNLSDLIALMGSEHQLVVRLLIDAGADRDVAADDCGLTALMATAISGNAELARILLAKRSNKLATDSDALKLAEGLESPAGLKGELEKFENVDQRRALRRWVKQTSPGRREIAKMLRAHLN